MIQNQSTSPRHREPRPLPTPRVFASVTVVATLALTGYEAAVPGVGTVVFTAIAN